MDKNSQSSVKVVLTAAGEDVTKVLVKTSVRMMRVVGKSINDLEAEITRQFPGIISIQLIVH